MTLTDEQAKKAMRHIRFMGFYFDGKAADCRDDTNKIEQETWLENAAEARQLLKELEGMRKRTP